jgi:nitrile hydratase
MLKQHDVGGHTELFSEIITSSDAPMSLWEKQIHAILGLLVRKNVLCVDELRRAVEQLDSNIYAKWSYYGRWAVAIAQICLEKNVLSTKDILWEKEEQSADQLYKVGDYIQIQEENIFTKWCKPHIRTPGYIFGMIGVVESYAGQFPDAEQQGWGVSNVINQHVFRVRLLQKDIWPDYHGNDADTVDVEVFQNWLKKSSKEDYIKQRERRNQFSLKSNTVVHDPCNKDQQGGQSKEKSQHERKHDHEHHHEQKHHDHDHDHHHHDEHKHHDHDHDHHHHDEDHGHTHEERAIVEQVAVDKEVYAIGQQFAEVFTKVVLAKGLVTEEELRTVVERVEAMGAHQEGARIVAKAWKDSEYKARLLENGNAACIELGIVPSNSHAATFLRVMENTDEVHNLIVCTLCSCYPLSILGPSPSWYKSRSYRARAVKEPRAVLKDFGTAIPDEKVIRVHDSTSDLRFMVLPQQPKGTENLSEEELVALVTRDALIGVTVL